MLPRTTRRLCLATTASAAARESLTTSSRVVRVGENVIPIRLQDAGVRRAAMAAPEAEA